MVVRAKLRLTNKNRFQKQLY